ncbi:MAG: ABC transporter ATP-binding protein [Cyanobacteria bacterium J06656_5]
MLTLDRVSYHPAASATPILSQVSFTLEPKKMGLIVGPSGSGKSTLLEILAGLVSPSKGSLHWRDQELQPETLQQLAGLVFQFPERHFCGHTVLEELRIGHPELGSEQVTKTLESVGLGAISLQAAPHALSGGQQRRLALAVQLIRQPYLLLLDEPTAGLDWSMKQQLIGLLADLKKDWSLLVVSHDARDLAHLADYCWTLQNGELLSQPLEMVPVA